MGGHILKKPILIFSDNMGNSLFVSPIDCFECNTPFKWQTVFLDFCTLINLFNEVIFLHERNDLV